MGMVKRSPSPPEACRSQLLPDWWVQQPSAGEGGSPAPWGGRALTAISLHALLLGVVGHVPLLRPQTLSGVKPLPLGLLNSCLHGALTCIPIIYLLGPMLLPNDDDKYFP